MSDDLSVSVTKIRSSASALNTITDALNNNVEQIEDILGAELSIGTYASVLVAMDTDQRNGIQTAQSLEYRRVGSKFRIAVVWSSDFDPETENVKPWSDCARAIKAETAKKLPELINELSKKVDEQVDEIGEGYDAAVAVLRSLDDGEVE